jgi:hypothetical protein
MTTKQEMLAIIKAENSEGLRVGSDQDGYTELSKAETDAILDSWAEARLAKEKAIAEAEVKAVAKADLLNRLGITEEEAKLLIG